MPAQNAVDLSLQREPIAGLWAEVLPLAVGHHAGSPVVAGLPLDPDCQAYAAIEGCGRLRAYTARADGELIGYAVFFVMPNMHHRTVLTAAHDVLFVHPDHRAGGTALRLMAYANRELAAEGVELVTHAADVGTGLGALYERLGYQLACTIYAKRLDRGED